MNFLEYFFARNTYETLEEARAIIGEHKQISKNKKTEEAIRREKYALMAEEKENIDTYLTELSLNNPYPKRTLCDYFCDISQQIEFLDALIRIGSLLDDRDALKAKQILLCNDTVEDLATANELLDLFCKLLEDEMLSGDYSGARNFFKDCALCYLYKSIELSENNEDAKKYLGLLIESDIYFKAGDFFESFQCIIEALGWESLLRNAQSLYHELPVSPEEYPEEIKFQNNTETYYVMLIVNLINIYLMMDLPQEAERVRRTFSSIYGYSKRLFSKYTCFSLQLKTLDATEPIAYFKYKYFDEKLMHVYMQNKRDNDTYNPSARVFEQILDDGYLYPGIGNNFFENVEFSFFHPEGLIRGDNSEYIYFSSEMIEDQKQLFEDVFSYT